MKKVFVVMGIEKLRTSAYHPHTDGQVEQFNRTLETLLTSFVNDRHNDWDLHLSMALFAYRNSRHASTGVSPFLAVHGREARMPLDFSLNGQESRTHVMRSTRQRHPPHRYQDYTLDDIQIEDALS